MKRWSSVRSFQVLNKTKQNWSSWIPTSYQPKTSATLSFPFLTGSGIVCSFSSRPGFPSKASGRAEIRSETLSFILCAVPGKSSRINGPALKHKSDVGKAGFGFDLILLCLISQQRCCSSTEMFPTEVWDRQPKDCQATHFFHILQQNAREEINVSEGPFSTEYLQLPQRLCKAWSM